MTTLLSTLGFTPDKLLPAVIAIGRVDKVVIYHAPGETPAKETSARRALENVLAALKGFPLRVEPRRLPHPWRVPEMLEAMLEDIRRERPDHCVFNLTGGTKAMAVAATLACVLTGTRAIYVPEESPDPKPVPLPLPALRLTSPLSDRRARVLRALVETKYLSQAALATAVKLAESTVHHHLREMRRASLVEPTADTRKSPPRATEAGRLLLRLSNPRA